MGVLRIVAAWTLSTLMVTRGDAAASTFDACHPRQVHLSFGKTSREIVVMWSTRGDCSTKVKYGLAQFMKALNMSQSGASMLFKGSNSSSNQQHYTHHVVLQNLQPGTMYYYMPFSNKSSSGPDFFKTPPVLDNDKELQMMVFSDVSTSSPAISAIVTEALTGEYTALLHLGNIAMSLSSENGMNGDHYMTSMEQAIRTVPYLTSPGPAETEDGSFSHYISKFAASQQWPTKLDELWYSLDIGLVHLISYSTEVFYSEAGKYSSVQHDWLIKDLKLANTNRKNVPWIVAFGHRPMYCTSEDPALTCNPKISKSSNERTELEDIFYHYGVDVVMQSNGKTYERTYPIYKNTLVTDNYTNPLGPIHIICGGASPWSNEDNFTSPAPTWSAFRHINDSALTYGRLRIINATTLTYEQISLDDDSVVDSFEIFQEKHGQFSTSKLPANITAEIDKERIDAGEKPGTLNIEEVGSKDSKSGIAELLHGDNKVRLIIGVSCAAFVAVAVMTIVFVKLVKRKKKATRRWEQMDINYGKKFYSKAPEKDEDNDFEIDMSDGTEPTRKLLTADD